MLVAVFCRTDKDTKNKIMQYNVLLTIEEIKAFNCKYC